MFDSIEIGNMKFNISTEYSLVTGLRHCEVSDKSGEDFYHTKLNAAFADAYRNNEKLELILDGVIGGYTPSFLDEAIGNLVYDFGLAVVKQKLVIISDKETQWIAFVNERTYPAWEQRRIERQEPKITEPHKAWYRLINYKLEEKVWIQI